jgi:hypothetical protein
MMVVMVLMMVFAPIFPLMVVLVVVNVMVVFRGAQFRVPSAEVTHMRSQPRASSRLLHHLRLATCPLACRPQIQQPIPRSVTVEVETAMTWDSRLTTTNRLRSIDQYSTHFRPEVEHLSGQMFLFGSGAAIRLAGRLYNMGTSKHMG